MDHSFKLRNLFFKTAKALNDFNKTERIRNQKKLLLINEIEDDLFFLKESVKKVFRDNKLRERTYDLLMNRISKISLELKETKKKLTSL